jgi:dephospho-CoA kinase
MSDPRADVFTVVLTGGIASGKTVVSDLFGLLGITVIDTDQIAREIVQPGRSALAEIAREFGPKMLDANGQLDRATMRKLIFDDPQARDRLERILHPRIAREALNRVRQTASEYCLLVVPLYVETGRWSWVDRVLVVDAQESTQIERVMARDKASRAHAKSILQAQASRPERLAVADDIIENNADLDSLRLQVTALDSKYRALAAQKRTTRAKEG